MNQVTSQDGTVIAFSRAGTGPAVVLVDAASCFRGFGPMAELAEQLAEHFTVYHYDRRGRGESGDTEPYAVEREVDDLNAVIGAAGGSAFVYGFSSGALLALHAASRGLPIGKLALMEPPVELHAQPQTDPDPLVTELTDLLAQGRRGEAFERFQRGIGTPDEIVTHMLESPAWPELQALAHTLVYDLEIIASLSADDVAAVETPTVVINSAGSDDSLRGWAQAVADALPNAEHRTLPGEWHGVPAKDLAAAVDEYFTDQPTGRKA